MSYKNTMKLFASNFALVWKQLLYLIVCLVIFLLGAYITGRPIVQVLRTNGIYDDFNKILATVYNSPSQFALSLSEILRHTFLVIFSNFSSLWLSIVGLILLCILIPYFLVQISFYNIASIIYQKISMNMNVGYIQNGIQNLWKSIKFALATIVINIPFLIFVFFLFYVYIMIATSVVLSIIGLIFLSALLIITFSVKITLFTGYIGYMIDKQSGAFAAFGKGSLISLKNFWKILSVSIIITLTIILVNGFITLFTFFSGLLIAIPATFVLLAVYYLVVYFNKTGSRYYLGDNFIYNPVKYTIKKDDFAGTFLSDESKELESTEIKLKKKKSKTKKIKNKTVKE